MKSVTIRLIFHALFHQYALEFDVKSMSFRQFVLVSGEFVRDGGLNSHDSTAAASDSKTNSVSGFPRFAQSSSLTGFLQPFLQNLPSTMLSSNPGQSFNFKSFPSAVDPAQVFPQFEYLAPFFSGFPSSGHTSYPITFSQSSQAPYSFKAPSFTPAKPQESPVKQFPPQETAAKPLPPQQLPAKAHTNTPVITPKVSPTPTSSSKYKPPPPPPASGRMVDGVDVEAVLEAHNVLRREENLSELQWDPELAAKGQAWSRLMEEENFFDHHRPGHEDEAQMNNLFKGPDCVLAVEAFAYEKANLPADHILTRENLYDVGHYLMLMWKDTHYVGCGRGVTKYCSCYYRDPGNVLGKRAF